MTLRITTPLVTPLEIQDPCWLFVRTETTTSGVRLFVYKSVLIDEKSRSYGPVLELLSSHPWRLAHESRGFKDSEMMFGEADFLVYELVAA